MQCQSKEEVPLVIGPCWLPPRHLPFQPTWYLQGSLLHSVWAMSITSSLDVVGALGPKVSLHRCIRYSFLLKLCYLLVVLPWSWAQVLSTHGYLQSLSYFQSRGLFPFPYCCPKAVTSLLPFWDSRHTADCEIRLSPRVGRNIAFHQLLLSALQINMESLATFLE